MGVFLLYIWLTMPAVEELHVENIGRGAEIYSRDGVLLARFSVSEDKHFVKEKELPIAIKKALVCAEDPTFYNHKGIEWGRYFQWNAKKSTITQQLARLYLKEKGGAWLGFGSTFQEILLTYLIERQYTKDEILSLYLNYAHFSGNMVGIYSISQAFFSKLPKDLSIEESVLLAGLLKAPSYYNPVRHKERALKRRNEVLSLMGKYGYLKRSDVPKVQQLPLVLNRNVKAATQKYERGIAPYFVLHVKKWLKDWAKKKGIDLYRSGIKVYTTLDTRLQRHADSAMVEHLTKHQIHLERELSFYGKPWEKDSSILIAAMRRSMRYKQARAEGFTESEIRQEFNQPMKMKVFAWDAPNFTRDTLLSPWDSLKYYAKFLHVGFLALNPKNGHVLSWIGGADANYFHYDHVAYGKRQVGSTFKPFVYAAAFDHGFKPCDQVPNQYISFPTREGTLWTPRNSDGEVGQDTCIRDAIAGSINIVAARVAHKIGIPTVVDYAHKIGIGSFLDTVPSLALGPMELGIMEMTRAYATFANYGKRIEPIFVTHIEDAQGEIIERFTPQIEQVLSEHTAYTVIQMLRSVVDLGTGSSLRWKYAVLPYDNEIAGKTGTSQSHSDGWFMAFTTDLVIGCWVGSEDRRVHFLSELGQGKDMALPVVALFLKRVYEDETIGLRKSRFRRPNGYNIDTFCHPLIVKKDTLPADSILPIDTMPPVTEIPDSLKE